MFLRLLCSMPFIDMQKKQGVIKFLSQSYMRLLLEDLIYFTGYSRMP